jgi:hypothetical protein
MNQLVRVEDERPYLLALRQLSHGSLSGQRPSGHWVLWNLSGETPSGWATATVAEHWLSHRSHAVLTAAFRWAEVVSVVKMRYSRFSWKVQVCRTSVWDVRATRVLPNHSSVCGWDTGGPP